MVHRGWPPWVQSMVEKVENASGGANGNISLMVWSGSQRSFLLKVMLNLSSKGCVGVKNVRSPKKTFKWPIGIWKGAQHH